MSAVGSILMQVEQKVMGILAGFTASEDEQNQRLSALETRVDTLESAAQSPAPRTRTAQSVASKARGGAG